MDDSPGSPVASGGADFDNLDFNDAFAIEDEGEGAGPSLATFLAKTEEEEPKAPLALGRIGLLPMGVKKARVVQERQGATNGAPDAELDAFSLSLEGNAPPEPDSGATETLGNLDRANQFAMDMGGADDSGGGQFFDPDREGSPVGGEKPTAVKVPAGRRKSPSARRAPPGRGGAVIAAGPTVSKLVVDANRSIPQTLANVLLISLLVGSGFLVFVATQHDGLLDIYELGDMTASAFGRGTYQGRGAGSAEKTEKVDETVVVEDVEQLYFPNKNGADLFVVEGKVVNRSEQTLKDVFVGGSVYNSRGDLLSSATAPAGRAITEEELLKVVDRKSLGEVSKDISKEVADLRLGPKQALQFSVVFPSLPGGVGQRRTFKVAVDAYLDANAAEPAKPKVEEPTE
jgi:hypothetical protein